ncbi:MAG TPA: ABC transporter ATP-binding protein/permease [Actinobacteria bacterium]|nr:ABC transporter ATP-binding protein/permease [Actinomycetota bacterium]
MLRVKDVSKSYTTGDFTQIALDDVSLEFGKTEFVAVLGPSGSGKTTFLNLIGGLDKYDSGDLIINGKSTRDFADWEWDAYRNNSVGFVFQTYNLITHLSVLDNVEMGLTLSGVPAAEKHAKAVEALERVGLKDHIHKKPNQLSGGQMQRVAIARALANDPDIILADEPTGALDTVTSAQVMDLIKEIAADKLVIMVTHNSELAEEYADRIVRFQDGHVIADSNPTRASRGEQGYRLKKTSMGFRTALKLSGRNIATKKWRTTLTALASSIGIIGIALILSLSNGFGVQVDQFQNDALSEFPVIIAPTSMEMDAETMDEMRGELPASRLMGETEYADTREVALYDPADETIAHVNVITDEYVKYVQAIDPEICNGVGYLRMVGMNLLREVDGEIVPASISIGTTNPDGMQSMSPGAGDLSSMSGVGLSSYPEPLNSASTPYLETNYDLLSGEYPTETTDLVLVVDNMNRIDRKVFDRLGFDVEATDEIPFGELVGLELKLVDNDDFYTKTPMGNFVPGTDYEAMYDSENSTTLRISGVVRLKPDVAIGLVGNGIAYSDRLVQIVTENAADSAIVKAQQDADFNVITLEAIDENQKSMNLAYLGGESVPLMMFLYPTDFESKDAVLAYLDDYNVGLDEADAVIYTDLAKSVTEMTGGIMDGITLVLVAFAAISLVVSLIMISIITYISVLERTKEIGVLRALGARKKDITRVFTAETFIIGVFSGLLGIGIAYILTIPANTVIENMTGLAEVSQLPVLYALALVAISVALTLVGGAIPARMAADKDPVEALRSE